MFLGSWLYAVWKDPLIRRYCWNYEKCRGVVELAELSLLSHYPYSDNAEATAIHTSSTCPFDSIKRGGQVWLWSEGCELPPWVAALPLKPNETLQNKGFYEDANYYCSIKCLVLPLFRSACKERNWTKKSAEVFSPIVGKGLGITVLKSQNSEVKILVHR